MLLNFILATTISIILTVILTILILIVGAYTIDKIHGLFEKIT